jgi:hypothetical protein
MITNIISLDENDIYNAIDLLEITQCRDPFNDIIFNHYNSNIYATLFAFLDTLHKYDALLLLHRYKVRENAQFTESNICFFLSEVITIRDRPYDKVIASIKYISDYFNISSSSHVHFMRSNLIEGVTFMVKTACNYVYIIYVLKHHMNLKDYENSQLMTDLLLYAIRQNRIDIVKIIIDYVRKRDIIDSIGMVLFNSRYEMLDMFLHVRQQCMPDGINLIKGMHKSHDTMQDDKALIILYKYGCHNDRQLTKSQTIMLLDKGHNIKNKAAEHYKRRMQERQKAIKCLFACKGRKYSIYDPNVAILICKFISYRDL